MAKCCGGLAVAALLVVFSRVDAAQAPAFEAARLGGAEKFSFDPANLSKPTLVVFWASWCAPCRYEVPDLLDLQKNQGERLSFLGVSVDQKREKSEKFIEDFRLSYPNLFDPEARVASLLGVQALPTLVLIDRRGEIRFRGNRMNQEFQTALRQTIGP